MNKTKIILISIGAVCGVAALVLAYLVFDTISTTGAEREELEGARETLRKQVNAEIKPVKAAVDAIEQNRLAYEEWTAEANRLAARGDKRFAPTTDAAFKTFMVAEAHRMAEFPGGAEGKLVKAGFPFGFQQYILDGAMPPTAELPKLQRQWDDVTAVVTTLAKAGVFELQSIQLKDAASAMPAPEAREEQAGGRGRRKSPPRRNQANAAKEEQPFEVTVMAVEMLTRPAALVEALNSFATSERFVVVDDFKFVRERDDIVDAIGVDAKKQEAQAAPSGRRRRRAAAEEAEAQVDEDAAKKGKLAVDPLKSSLLKVTMTVKVFDFKTLEQQKEVQQ